MGGSERPVSRYNGAQIVGSRLDSGTNGKALDLRTYTSVTEMSLLPVPRIPMTSHVSMISHSSLGK